MAQNHSDLVRSADYTPDTTSGHQPQRTQTSPQYYQSSLPRARTGAFERSSTHTTASTSKPEDGSNRDDATTHQSTARFSYAMQRWMNESVDDCPTTMERIWYRKESREEPGQTSQQNQHGSCLRAASEETTGESGAGSRAMTFNGTNVHNHLR